MWEHTGAHLQLVSSRNAVLLLLLSLFLLLVEGDLDSKGEAEPGRIDLWMSDVVVSTDDDDIVSTDDDVASTDDDIVSNDDDIVSTDDDVVSNDDDDVSNDDDDDINHNTN